MRRGMIAALVAATFLLTPAVADTPATGADSNLPVPRFVALKTDGANGRRGPGVDQRIEWVYAHAGLPLQVTDERGPWRRVRDPEGIEVWMHAQNLDNRRTVFVKENAALRRNAHESSQPVAYLAPGVIGAMTGCEGEWRRVAVGGRVGWVSASSVWGADCAG